MSHVSPDERKSAGLPFGGTLAWRWTFLAPLVVGVGGWFWTGVIDSQAACRRGEPLPSEALLGWAALLAIAVLATIVLARRERLRLVETATVAVTVAGLGAFAVFLARAVWFIAHGCAS